LTPEPGDAIVWRTPRLFLLVPGELADELLDPLREAYAHEPAVEVIVDRRQEERRSGDDRRGRGDRGDEEENRRRGLRRRRARRAPQLQRGVSASGLAPEMHIELPPIAREHAERLRFVQRMEPVHRSGEQTSAVELITRTAAGDEEAFSMLYWRYFGRVYAHLRTLVGDPHTAERLVDPAFSRAFDDLAAYRPEGGRFDNWLQGHVLEIALEHLHEHPRRAE
jgi:Sigma-70 region 2